MTVIPFSDELMLHVPKHRIEDYFGNWAIIENDFREGLASFMRMDFRAHLAEHQARQGDAPPRAAYQVTPGGVAVIEMAGVMMKQESSMGGASTVATRRAIRNAVNDESVRSIALVIDSPGGSVAGTSDLASDVAAAAKVKPLYAYVQDTGASAAYWVASHASKVFANGPTARVGSIGTFTVLHDSSRMYQNAGIDVHVVAAGEFKGIGEEGAPITPKQLEVTKVAINDLNEQFIKAVAKGRGVAVSKVREWADGRVFLAEKAIEMGMIDGIQSLDETVSMLSKARKPRMAAAASERLAAWDETTQAWVEIDGREAVASEAHTPSERSEVTPKVEETVMSETQVSAPVETQVEKQSAKPAEVMKLQVGELRSTAASLKELEAACYGADDKFLMAQLKAEASIETAQRAWQTELVRQRDEANSKAEAASQQTANVQATITKPGAAPIKSASSETAASTVSGDPVAAWNDAVNANLAKGMPRAKAVKMAARDKDLHAAFVAASNAGR